MYAPPGFSQLTGRGVPGERADPQNRPGFATRAAGLASRIQATLWGWGPEGMGPACCPIPKWTAEGEGRGGKVRVFVGIQDLGMITWSRALLVEAKVFHYLFRRCIIIIIFLSTHGSEKIIKKILGGEEAWGRVSSQGGEGGLLFQWGNGGCGH